MKKIGVFYGSSTGNVASVANKLSKILGVDNVYDVSKSGVQSRIANYDIIFLGSSTWGDGDVEDDWDIDALKAMNLKGKKVAVFGTGDSESFPDTFCNGMSYLADAALQAGATLIGNHVDLEGYTFEQSLSEVNGYFVGLAIDEDNEAKLTDSRIANWIEQLKPELDE